MKIRPYWPEDEATARKLFERYYTDGGYSFPDLTKYLCAYTILDDENNIITVGGIRIISEMCLITDKTASGKLKVKALKEALKAAKYIAQKFSFKFIHVIVNDKLWASHLKHNGFESRGEDLTISVGDIK